jgi:hypothetical protein
VRHPLSILANAASLGMGALDVASRYFLPDTITDEFYEGDAFHGYGSQLKVGNGVSPEEFFAIADIKTITPGSMETAEIEKTHLRSPEAHREWLAGLRDSGAFVITGNWRPAHYSQNNAGDATISGFATGGLLKFWRDRQTRNWQIVCSDEDETTFPFSGFVKKFQPGEIGIDGIVPFTAEIRPAGDFSADLP